MACRTYFCLHQSKFHCLFFWISSFLMTRCWYVYFIVMTWRHWIRPSHFSHLYFPLLVFRAFRHPHFKLCLMGKSSPTSDLLFFFNLFFGVGTGVLSPPPLNGLILCQKSIDLGYGYLFPCSVSLDPCPRSFLLPISQHLSIRPTDFIFQVQSLWLHAWGHLCPFRFLNI